MDLARKRNDNLSKKREAPLVPPVHANNRVWIPPQTRVFCKKSIGQGTKLAISSAEEEIIHLPLRPQKWCPNECEDAARHPRFLCHNHLFLLPQNPCSKSRVPKMCPKSYFSPKNACRKGFAEISTKPYFSMAERVGFEPTVAHHHTWFRVKHLRPLGHLSMPLCDKSHYIIGASAWQGIFLHCMPRGKLQV